MSLYTSVIVYPDDPTFRPSEDFVKELLEFFGTSKILCASGNQLVVDDDDGQTTLFFLQNPSLDEALAAAHSYISATTCISLAFGDSLRVFSDSVSANISREIAGDFLPWDTAITLGKWDARDYDTGKIVASGNFCITKSGNGCPPSLAVYLDRIKENPELKKMIAFLELKTGCKWKTTIELS